MKKIIIIFIIFASLLIIGYFSYTNISIIPYDLLNMLRTLRDTGQEITKSTEKMAGIPLKAKIYDSNFIVEKFVTGLSQPTAMAFVGNDIFVLEKNTGYVKLIQNGNIISEPIFDFNVTTTNESGLLGITSNDNDVYIFVTEAKSDGGNVIGNNIYHFIWDGKNLANQQLLNTLSSESSWHNGGSLTTDLNGQVFAVIGDQMGGGRSDLKNEFRILQNVNHGEIDDSGIIIKVGFEDGVIHPKLSKTPLDHYYAIGIRNSFGLAVDPFTGNLWDSENGPDHSDEINLVSENFNSGWSVVMGFASQEQISQIPQLGNFKYSDPEFNWERTVVPTGLTFVNSDLFDSYQNYLFVGTCSAGQILKFKLNDERTEFEFISPHLQDLTANIVDSDSGKQEFESLEELIFGDGFGCITDIKFGMDGNLYVVSITDNSIYRILPR